MKKYTKVVTLGGKSSVGWWYGDDSVVQGFIGDDFDTREEAEAYFNMRSYMLQSIIFALQSSNVF